LSGERGAIHLYVTYFSESSEDDSSLVDLEPPRKRLRSSFALDGTGIKYCENSG